MDGKYKEWGCEEYELGLPPSPPPPPGGDAELFSPPPESPCRLDLDDGSASLEKPYVREMEKTIEGSRFIAQHVKNKDKFESVSVFSSFYESAYLSIGMPVSIRVRKLIKSVFFHSRIM